MLVVVFRSRLRPGLVEADFAALGALGTRMHDLAIAMPGFVSYKDFASEDGEAVTIVEFASAETLLAWRDHPEHKEAQRLGRERFFLEYSIQVCDLVRGHRFEQTPGR